MGIRKDFNPVLVMLIDPTLGDFYVMKSGGWEIKSAEDGTVWYDKEGHPWFYDADEGTWFDEEDNPLPDPNS